MSFQPRGSIPRTFTLAVATTGLSGNLGYYRFPAESTRVQVQNLGANVLRLYWTEADFVADTNYVQVPPIATSTPGQWEGPVRAVGIYMRSVTGATTAGLTVFLQQG